MNQAYDVTKHITEMSDDELLAAARTARDDLAVAEVDEPESEWHQACFAAAMIYGLEMETRGLTLATKH